MSRSWFDSALPSLSAPAQLVGSAEKSEFVVERVRGLGILTVYHTDSPHGRMTIKLKPTSGAVVESRTMYPKLVRAPGDVTSLLKPGKDNKKLGWKIRRDRKWGGMPIYSLTLEERKTCPATCAHWRTCYGNGMRYAHRMQAGPDLEARLRVEVAALAVKHPAGFVVRLHVLGDFYSAGYVWSWRKLMRRHTVLRVFGYTAWQPDTAIGKRVAALNAENPDRAMIRYSGMDAPQWASNAIEADRDGFTCPQQTGKVETCAACAACWTTTRSVNFLFH